MTSARQPTAPSPNASIDLEKAEVAAAYDALATSPEGLSATEARARLGRYGRNELAALKAGLAPKATVRRDGAEVVPLEWQANGAVCRLRMVECERLILPDA